MTRRAERGWMLKRYAHSHRPEPDEGEKAYERSEAFGRVLEADHIFPAEGSSGHEGEKNALIVLDLYTGLSMVYPGKDRAEDISYLALKHCGGHRLNGDPNVVFKADAATELVKAAERLCWTTSPSVPRDSPHAAHVDREIRSVIQAGFNKKMWPTSVVYTDKSRAF